MTEYINRESAIAVIEGKQKELCPVGMYSRHSVYGSDRDAFDAWQEIINELESIPAADVVGVSDSCNKFGKWKKLEGSCATPGGTPIYVCSECGGSQHLHGFEYSRRKMVCDDCGSINSYPWEKTYEEEN